ncbi:MAG: hypothetical protein ORN58_03870, partial [Sediminibacterium sp.]|nr:hypothetical protein [Sediminibacterium sp.]
DYSYSLPINTISYICMCIKFFNMKNILSILLIFSSIIACKKDEITPPKPTPFSPKISFSITANNPAIDLGEMATTIIKLKNDSSVTINATAICSITNFDLIDSIFMDNQIIQFPNGKIIFQKNILANSSISIAKKFILKKNISVEDNKKSVSLILDTIMYANNVIGFNMAENTTPIFSVAIAATAFADTLQSKNVSIITDDFVVGNSVMLANTIFWNTPGTAKIEVVGRKEDGTNPISHYWITNSTDEDFGVRVSNFNSNNNVLVNKTAVNSFSFNVNLSAGVNNIIFKTGALYGRIKNGDKVGLKIYLANVCYNAVFVAMSDSVDLADKIVVANTWYTG